MASVITIAGEQLFAAKAQANEQLDIDTFIFANVPNQDPSAPINREEGIPTAHIVYQQNVQQVGRINDNVVVYSAVLDSITGPFEFNWVGLYSSVNQKLVAINHVPTVTKTASTPGEAGNTLNRNFGIEYSGIAELTGIVVDQSTWQIDYTARLSGMDKLTQQLATDMNGKDWFIDDGLKVVPRATANSFSVTPGVGYVSGLRVELKQEHILIVQTYPQFVYVDAWFSGNANSTWSPQLAFTVTNTEMDDYIDPSGTQHYVYKLAVINAADDVEDLRENKGLNKKIDDLKYDLSSENGAELSLSQVCTAYSIEFSKTKKWKTGELSDKNRYWLHKNKVWQSNQDNHVLEAEPNFLTAHIVPQDGILYPDHFGASYIPGTDQGVAIRRFEQFQKQKNEPIRLKPIEHTILTQIVIDRAPNIICESGGYGTTTSTEESSDKRPQGAVLIGKVQNDFSLVISPSKFSYGGQIKNVTITGKAHKDDDKNSGHGVRLHNFGWSSRIEALNILDFDGKGLSIGYLQDTVFEQLSIIGCGPNGSNRSLSFTHNSNYIYFNNPHIEDTDYLLGCSEANNKPWEIHFIGGHIESGDYNGQHGEIFDHSYTSPPFEFNGCYRWYFEGTTMVPASVQQLMSRNGGDSASQPYFMEGINTSKICGNNVRFICPRDDGGIDAIKLTGLNSDSVWLNTHIEGAQGAKFALNFESGSFTNGSISFKDQSETRMDGININVGFVDKIRFSSNQGGEIKTSGYLIHSYVQAGLTSGEHLYELGTEPFKWMNQYVISTDRRINDYKNAIDNEIIDVEKIRPDFGIFCGNPMTIENIINVHRSRRLLLRNGSGGNLTIKSTGSVKPNTANNMVVGPYSVASMTADHTGILYQF